MSPLMGWVEELPSGRFRAGFRLPSGKKIQTIHDYRYEAVQWLDRQQAERPPPPVHYPPIKLRAPLLVDFAQDWLARAPARDLAPDTIAKYQREVARIADGPLAGLRLDEIKRMDIERALAKLAATGAKATPRMHAKILRMIFADALNNEIIHRDPARATGKLPRYRAAPRRALQPAQWAALLLAADPYMRAFILAALDAGLRWNEINGLDTVSIDGVMLTVWQTSDRAGLLRPFTKDREPRRVPLTDRLATALAELGPGLLFTVDGSLLTYSAWRWRWDETRKRAGLACPFHALRHTYATRLAAANVPPIEIAAALGHADLATTGIYTHAGSEAARAALIRAALAEPAPPAHTG